MLFCRYDCFNNRMYAHISLRHANMHLDRAWPFCFCTDVTVSLNQDSAVFSDNNEDFERICHYTG